jgi:hypothetical protein
MTDQRPENASPTVTALIAATLLLAAFYLAWPIYRATLPMEIDVNEPWNANFSDAAWHKNGQPLYPKPDGLLVNNYPPLSFYLVGGIASIAGDPIAVGRWISLFAVFALAAGTAACVRALGGSWLAAIAAAVWLLATFARFFESYVGMNDPHLFALAVMVGALAWLIRRQKKGKAVEPAILLMVLTGFFKHNLLAVPVASLAWLAMSNRRQAARAATVGVGAAAVGLTLCGMIYGGDFFRQLFGAPRETSFLRAVAGLGRLQWIGPALVIFAIWAWDQRRSRWDSAARFAAIFVAVAFMLFFVQEMGAGVDDNAQFELAVAAAVGLALAFDRLDVIPTVRRVGLNRSRAAVLLILFIRLLISSHSEPYLLAFSGAFRENLRERATVTSAETARVAAIPGPIVCFAWKPSLRDPGDRTREEIFWRAIAFPDGGPSESITVTPAMTIGRRAGKPFVFDAFAADQRVKLGKISLDALKRRLNREGVHFVPVDHRVLTGRN